MIVRKSRFEDKPQLRGLVAKANINSKIFDYKFLRHSTLLVAESETTRQVVGYLYALPDTVDPRGLAVHELVVSGKQEPEKVVAELLDRFMVEARGHSMRLAAPRGLNTELLTARGFKCVGGQEFVKQAADKLRVDEPGDRASELEVGKKIEQEHEATYQKIKDYYKEHGKFPEAAEVYEWIGGDHLEEFETYYSELLKMEDRLKKEFKKSSCLLPVSAQKSLTLRMVKDRLAPKNLKQLTELQPEASAFTPKSELLKQLKDQDNVPVMVGDNPPAPKAEPKAGQKPMSDAQPTSEEGHTHHGALIYADGEAPANKFYDPNSTKNEGRKRLRDPKEFDQDTFRRWTTWAGQDAPDGVTFLVGNIKDGQKALQTIRFDKNKLTEDEAEAYFAQVVNTSGFEKTWKDTEWKNEFPGYKPKTEYMKQAASSWTTDYYATYDKMVAPFLDKLTEVDGGLFELNPNTGIFISDNSAKIAEDRPTTWVVGYGWVDGGHSEITGKYKTLKEAVTAAEQLATDMRTQAVIQKNRPSGKLAMTKLAWEDPFSDSYGEFIKSDGVILDVPDNKTHDTYARSDLGFKKGVSEALDSGWVRIMEREGGYYYTFNKNVTDSALKTAIGHMRDSVNADYPVGIDFDGDYREAKNKIELGRIIRGFGFSKAASFIEDSETKKSGTGRLITKDDCMRALKNAKPDLLAETESEITGSATAAFSKTERLTPEQTVENMNYNDFRTENFIGEVSGQPMVAWEYTDDQGVFHHGVANSEDEAKYQARVHGYRPAGEKQRPVPTATAPKTEAPVMSKAVKKPDPK